MSLLNQFTHIKCMVFDADGVLTDGSLILLHDGQMARTMNTKDGYALQLAVKKGYIVSVISGGGNEGARQRLNNWASQIFILTYQTNNRRWQHTYNRKACNRPKCYTWATIYLIMPA